jgi:hypothetical protein
MCNRRGDGAAFQAEAFYKRLGDRRGVISVHHDDLQDVFFGIAVQMAIAGQCVGNGYDEPVGDELSVQCLDTVALLHVLFFPPFVEQISKVGDDMGPGLEIIDGLGV